MSHLDQIVAMEIDAAAPCGCGGLCRACRERRIEASTSGPVGGLPLRSSPVGTPAGPITLPEWRGWGAGVTLYSLMSVANRVDRAMPPRPPGRPLDQAVLDAAWRAATRRSEPMPQIFRSYFVRAPMIYRIGRAALPRQAIDIGMTGRSLAAISLAGFRVMAHFLPSNRTARRPFLHSYLAQNTAPGRNLVAAVGLPRDGIRLVGDRFVLPPSLTQIQVHLGQFSPELRWSSRGAGRVFDIRYLHAFESVLQRREMGAAYGQIVGTRTFED
jgi:hypothetical protein